MRRMRAIKRRSFLFGAASAAVASSIGGVQSSMAEANGEGAGAKTKDQPKEQMRIGNLNALLPGGIAFVRDDELGVVLDLGWDPTGRPGVASPDSSINCIRLSCEAVRIRCDWGRVDRTDSVFVRFTSEGPAQLSVKFPARPWHAMNIAFRQIDPHSADVICFGPRGHQEVLRIRSDAQMTSVGPELGPSGELKLTLHSCTPLRMVVGFGLLPEIGQVDQYLDRAAERYASTRARTESAQGDFAGAISDNLNNSRMYSNISKEVVHVIGRGSWIVTDPDYLPYFVWDTSFNSLLASLEDPAGAEATLRTLLSYQLADGMLPRILNWNHDPEPFINIKNSNPPVTSLCAWKIYERWPDRNFLEEIFPKLLKWHDWWPKNRDGNSNGLLEWGSVGTFADARLETGWDDTPAFDGARLVGTQMNADAVDLNSLWAMDAEHLAKMADVLGLREDAERLRNDWRRTNRLMNERLWNEEIGLYCHRLWDENGQPGRFLTRLTPMNFYPLISGAPDEKRAKRVLDVLTDDTKFWGTWPIPTLPYDDPEWHRQDYWRGHTWPPVNYLLFQGVKRYASAQHQQQLAERSVELFMRNWRARGTCNETFNSTDGTGDRYPHYTWGALLCQIGLESLLNISPHGTPTATHVAEEWGDFSIHNIPSGGKLYSVKSKDGSIVVLPEGLAKGPN